MSEDNMNVFNCRNGRAELINERAEERAFEQNCFSRCCGNCRFSHCETRPLFEEEDFGLPTPTCLAVNQFDFGFDERNRRCDRCENRCCNRDRDCCRNRCCNRDRDRDRDCCHNRCCNRDRDRDCCRNRCCDRDRDRDRDCCRNRCGWNF